ncbi:hypothetical protein HII36_46460 [Nonomuraea sp. NN258]|uniref:hypothetical protein n=1 Tax=Nonomuraea antri TaxID=2730852 RepID=UPI0015688A10|nr:hypothetical protein [Nonomuraea antri]NRQ39217.1 hypothetical protein [Nonomuraea antri]
MKGSLIAVGGALAAAAVVALAGPASADPGHGRVVSCDLSTSDETTSLRIHPWGVSATERDADACDDGLVRRPSYDWRHGHGHGHGHHWGHGLWPGHFGAWF